MNTHEFGTESGKTIPLIHPSPVMRDYFEYVIPVLKKRLILTVIRIAGAAIPAGLVVLIFGGRP